MASHSHPHAPHSPHVLSIPVLLGTALALFALTGVTVAVARVDLGSWNVVVALGVASVKALLVAAFFMHLKYGKGFNAVVLGVAVLFAVLLTGFVLFDTTQYQQDIRELAAQPKAPTAKP